MKISKILTVNKNKRNGQIVCTLKKTQLKKMKISPEDFFKKYKITKDKRKVKW
jgi:hypothetical protein